MTLFNILLAVLVSGSLGFLGLLVFLNNPRSYTNKLFFLMALTFAGSALGVYMAAATTTSSVAFFWVKVLMLFASWSSTVILFFIYTFPREKFTFNKFFVIITVFVSLVFSYASIFNLFYKKVEYINGNLKTELGPFLPLFMLYFLVLLVAIVFRLFQGLRKSVGRDKEQIKYLIFGLLLSLTFVGFFDILLILALKITAFTSLGVSAFLFFEGAVFYSITRHRLMDIRLVVARTVAYTLLVGVIGIFYTVVSFAATSLLFKTTTTIEQISLYTVLTIIVAFTFQPLRHFLEEATDKIFYKGRYDSQELLTNLTKIMVKTLGLKDLTEGIIVRMLPEMRISKGAIVLLEKGKVDEIESAGFDKKTKFVGVDMLALLEAGKVLIADEMGSGKLKKIMEDLDVTVAVPFKIGEEELGVMLLGNKLSGEIYTDQDIDLLEILAPETSIAIKNAKAYEEIRKFSIHLQEEVAKATTDLRSANERLKELDKLKDEFMSIASHELRTPMTAIKSYVWLALNNRGGEIGSQLRNYLTKVYESSERMINMINDMLNVSRIETGRIQMEIAPTSIQKVLDQVVGDLSARASEAGVEIRIAKDQIIPLVLADKDKLAEIFTNLIGNALKFTPRGGTVSVSSRKIGDAVETSVTDTGVGIAKEDIGKLFKKYGRLDESYATLSPSTGTGLGLYITKQYLEKMDGSISVESTLGKGATFTFSLPAATGVTKEPEETKEIATFVPRRIIK